MASPLDVIRVVVKMVNGTDDIQNVYHMKVDGSGTLSDSEIMSEVVDLLDAAYLQVDQDITDDVSAVGIDFYNLTADTWMGSEDFTSFTGGTNSGTAMPPQTSPIVLFQTDTLRSQGRKFLPPVCTVNLLDTDGTPTALLLTHLALFAGSLLTGIDLSNGSGFFGNYNLDLDRFAYWTIARVPEFFATQRRRYFGKGT